MLVRRSGCVMLVRCSGAPCSSPLRVAMLGRRCGTGGTRWSRMRGAWWDPSRFLVSRSEPVEPQKDCGAPSVAPVPYTMNPRFGCAKRPRFGKMIPRSG